MKFYNGFVCLYLVSHQICSRFIYIYCIFTVHEYTTVNYIHSIPLPLFILTTIFFFSSPADPNLLLFSSISPPPSGGSSLPSFTDDDNLFPYGPTETATTTTTTSTIKFIGDELNKNLIPIYCSILAAVVVGLVAFIIFKR